MATTSEAFVLEVQKVSLKENDILVVRTESRITDDGIGSISKFIKTLPFKVTVIFAGLDDKFEVVSDNLLAKMGLKRI